MSDISLTCPKGTLACQVKGCGRPIVDAVLSLKDNNAVLTYQCAERHSFQVEMKVTNVTAVSPQPVKSDNVEIRSLRTKVVGVTFANADGTNRQDLLPHVSSGDALTIEKGSAPNGGQALLLRHKLGVIGVLKTATLREFSELFPDAEVIVRIVQLTGGTDVKSTVGCNIVLACAPDGEGQRIEEILGSEPDPRPRKNPSPDRQAYPDQSKTVFHCDEHCSGMKGAMQIGLRGALYQYHARPCKRCGAENLVKCLGWKPI